MSAPADKKEILVDKPIDRDLSDLYSNEFLSDIEVLNPATNLTYK